MFVLLVFLPKKGVNHRLRLDLSISLLLAENTSAKGLVKSSQCNYTEPCLGALPGDRRLLGKQLGNFASLRNHLIARHQLIDQTERRRFFRLHKVACHGELLIFRPTEMQAHPIGSHNTGDTGVDHRLAHLDARMRHTLVGDQSHLKTATRCDTIESGNHRLFGQ